MKKLLPVLLILSIGSLGLGLMIPAIIIMCAKAVIAFAIFYIAATLYLNKDQ